MDNQSMMFDLVQRIFSNWTALKLIVETDMATKEEAQIFTDYIAELLCINEELTDSDIAYELENYIASSFNTEVDDGSYMQVAEELLRFYNYLKVNEEITFKSEFEKLSPLKPWLITVQPQIQTQRCTVPDSSDEENQNNKMDVDEWTTVKSRRRSNK